MTRTHLITVVAIVTLSFASFGQAWAQTELIVNGGFESGLSSWTASGSFYYWNNPARAHSGSQYAYFGVASDGATPLVNGSGSIYQSISIPSGATSATLSFWLWVASDEGTTVAYDYLYVEVLNSSGSLLATLATYSNRDKSGSFSSTTPAYQQKSLSLTAYAGQTIRIRFRGTTDYRTATIFRLDDVSVSSTVPPPAARIDSYSPSSPVEVTVGSSTTISVTFTNTGNTAWSFIAGATV